MAFDRAQSDVRVFRNIQVLRFLSAILVMLYHFDGYQVAILGHLRSPALNRFGFVGVEIFFVISGAIIWLTTEQLCGPRDCAKFVYRRLARIFSIYWIVLGLQYSALARFTPDLLQKFDIVTAILLLPTHNYMLPIAWTLTLELLFYIMFAPLLLLRRGRGVVLGVYAVLVGGFLIFLPATQSWPTPPVYVLTFLAGCLAAFLAKRYRGRLAIAALSVGILIIAVATYVQLHVVFFSSISWIRVGVFGPAAFLIVYGAMGLEVSGRLVASSKAARFGDWTYSLYLLHYVAAVLFVPLGGLFVYQLAMTVRELALTLVVLSVVAIAGLTATWIELPLYRLLTRGMNSRQRTMLHAPAS